MKHFIISLSCFADSKEKVVSSLRNMIDCIECDEHEIDEISGFNSLDELWSFSIDIVDV